jgi:hypothetical protein
MISDQRAKRFPRLAATLAALACLALCCAALLMGQSPGGRSPAPRPAPRAAAAPVREAEVPFRAGERFSFQVFFSKFSVKAGAIEFAVVERRNFFGRPAWHFRARAQSVDTVRMLYPLDDQFDSYTHAGTLTTLQYEIYLRERGERQDNTWRMDTGEEPIPNGVPAARVLPGTRDPIGLLYVLRAADWKKNPEFRAPVFDGRRLYEVQARLAESSAQVTVSSGRFTASRIGVRVFERGRELTDTSFSVWLAEDATRTPILIEAALPIGSARVELTGRP